MAKLWIIVFRDEENKTAHMIAQEAEWKCQDLLANKSSNQN